MKRIVVCCDGTWEWPGRCDTALSAPSNVAKIAQMVAPCDEQGVQQLCLYQDGRGAELQEGGKERGTGLLLPHCIKEGYRFIASHFEAGDQVWFFGFSRGAYTARSIIGMIRNSGILREEHLDKVSLAYELYRNRFPETHPYSGYAEGFREAFSVCATVRFLGAWDTVGSLGVPDSVLTGFPSHSWSFHDLMLSSIVENAYHAVAMDESRSDYRSCLWRCGGGTTGEQVLFPGVHGDVGGGYEEAGLSDCALAWMVCKARNCGLAFTPDIVRVAPNPTGVLHDEEQPPPERGAEQGRGARCGLVSFAAQTRKERCGYRPGNWPDHPALQECPNRERCGNYFRCH